MSPAELVAIALAGIGAGFVNTLAGSGTLITFPTLLAIGVPPVTANVSNNMGLVPGAISGVFGFRRELRGQRARLLRLGPASLAGGTVGAVLLLVLPSEAFATIVPVLVGIGLLLVALGPRISRRVAARAEHAPETDLSLPEHDAGWLVPAVAGAGVYGGYFGAAQGIILVGALGVGTHETLLRNNALKNALAAIVNAVAALVFLFAADLDWTVVGLIAGGSIVGAQLAVRVGRRIPAAVLRGVIIVVGVTALAAFILD